MSEPIKNLPQWFKYVDKLMEEGSSQSFACNFAGGPLARKLLTEAPDCLAQAIEFLKRAKEATDWFGLIDGSHEADGDGDGGLRVRVTYIVSMEAGEDEEMEFGPWADDLLMAVIEGHKAYVKKHPKGPFV